MDRTGVHFRQFARIVSKPVWLWTELVVDNTIIHTDELEAICFYTSCFSSVSSFICEPFLQVQDGLD
jgi:hypothetical protein